MRGLDPRWLSRWWTQRGRHRRPFIPIAAGTIAAAVALAVMAVMRMTLQVRMVPERVLEAMLLVIPLDLFEIGLQLYGFNAKRYALLSTIIMMLLLLVAIGAWVVAHRWSMRRIVSLGLMLWLFVMIVIMPLTDAGLFAHDLVNGTKAAIAAHLAIVLAYAAVLAAAIAGLEDTQTPAGSIAARLHPADSGWPLVSSAPPTRRSALILSAGALCTLFGTFALVRWGPKLQLETVVVGGPSPEIPTTQPNASSPGLASAAIPAPAAAAPPAPEAAAAPPATVVMPTPGTPPPAVPTAVQQPTAAPTPRLAEQFRPPPLRRLSRDSDGVVLASGRLPGHLAETITAADDFYVVSKNAAQDPFIELDAWRLRVDGAVQRPIEIDYRSLRNLPTVETIKTLECISNFVTKCELVPFGCDLISTAQWKGARLRDVIALAGGLKAGVTSLSAIAADDYTTTLPIEAVMDTDTLLVYEMNGRPLTREHGYPARMLVPGRYGMKNAKWLVALRPVGRDVDDWYGQRNWTKNAIVKTMTRIDMPARDAELPPGHHRIAGIAYAGSRGIQQVEISVDGNEQWRAAEIIDRPAGRDVWVRWESSFTLAPATTLTLMARATDGDGELQMEAFSLPQPDGSTGWHSLDVRAQDAG